jgi:hypothetical protein
MDSAPEILSTITAGKAVASAGTSSREGMGDVSHPAVITAAGEGIPAIRIQGIASWKSTTFFDSRDH